MLRLLGTAFMGSLARISRRSRRVLRTAFSFEV